MGNSSSNSSRMSKKSESMEIRSKSARKASVEFSKSKSMMDMSNAKSTRLPGSAGARQKSITSLKDKEKSRANEVSRQKSIRKDAPHPISPQGREIISQCFENPHSEFANKVVQRIFEKRDDYQKFILNLGKERSFMVNVRLKCLVEEIVAHIHDSEFIEVVSKQYGEEHVELKQYGFKPDFWVAVADAMTLEGVILDMANHQPADTVSAWSSLVTMIFSSVRDGYYSELRRHRMSSRRTLRQQNTVDSGNNENENNDQSTPTVHRESSRIAVVQTAELSVTAPSHHSSNHHSTGSTKSHGSVLLQPVSSESSTPAKRETIRSLSVYSTDSANSAKLKRNGGDSIPPSPLPISSSNHSNLTRRPIFE